MADPFSARIQESLNCTESSSRSAVLSAHPTVHMLHALRPHGKALGHLEKICMARVCSNLAVCLHHLPAQAQTDMGKSIRSLLAGKGTTGGVRSGGLPCATSGHAALCHRERGDLTEVLEGPSLQASKHCYTSRQSSVA